MTEVDDMDIWHGCPRRVVGTQQVCLFPLTFGRWRLSIGPKDDFAVDDNY